VLRAIMDISAHAISLADRPRRAFRVGELDRRRIRTHFEHRFTAKLMAEEYLRHYERLVGAEAKSRSRSLAPAIAQQE
jgi:hypothetical protein